MPDTQAIELLKLWRETQDFSLTRDIELKHDFDNYCKMLEMLGEPTVNGFAALPKDTRRNAFRRCLVENELIEFDGFVEWQHCKAIYTFLLFKEHLEGNEIGQQLIQEARQIFYEENSFMLSSTLLQWFLSDPLGGWEKSKPVKSLVRDITIRVDRRHCRGEDMVPSLQEVFQFTDLERVSIEILDRGVPDGSDLATQETIKKISRVVKDLIGRFDERLQVVKVLFLDDDFKNGLTLCPAVHHDIKSYWSPPAEITRRRMREGKASFEEVMQVQIEEWTNSSFDPYPLNAVDELFN